MATARLTAGGEYAGTPAERALVQALFKDSLQVTEAAQANAILTALVKIAFRGGFSGGGAYFRWRCKSWLGERLGQVIETCEGLAGRSLLEFVLAPGSPVSDAGWEHLVDSYLLLNVPNYKQSRRPVLPVGAPSEWHHALDRLHAAWCARARAPRQSVDLSKPLEQRFGAWTAEQLASPVRYFGRRPHATTSVQLADLVRALPPALLASALASMRSARRHPFWPRLARRIAAERGSS